MAQTIADDLLKTFFKRSLYITLILTACLSVVVPSVLFLTDIHRYKKDSTDILNNFIKKEFNFQVMEILKNPRDYEYLLKKIEAFMEFSNLVEFKVWGADATVIYAYTDRSIIGRRFPTNEDLINTLKSIKTTANLEEAVEIENIALRGYGKLLEMYAPIIVNGEVVGAVEVYRKAPSFKFWGAHIFFVASLSITTMLLLYVLLYGQFKKASGEIIRYDRKLNDAYRTLGLSYFDTIRSLVKALELRDMETEGHSERVVAFSVYIAEKLSLSLKEFFKQDEFGKLVIGSYLHDIGKIGVSDTILLKPGRLTPGERKEMQTHVIKGFEIVKDVTFLKPATEVILCHHEKWDGTGYPRGLKGEEIPVTARIFALVDVFDALTNERPYKNRIPFEEAKKIIFEESGKHFDSRIVDIFMKISESEFSDIISEIRLKGIHYMVNAAIEKLLVIPK